MNLTAFGISTDLPPGWEGRIARRATPVGAPAAAGAVAGSTAVPTMAKGTPGEVPEPVVHLANFALPEQRGDFGSGAVDLMGHGHVFLCLFEYGAESRGQALFASPGIPRLTPAMFSPSALQKTIRGQAGCQRWFTIAGRPFCLYAVLGAHGEGPALVKQANRVLAATRVASR